MRPNADGMGVPSWRALSVGPTGGIRLFAPAMVTTPILPADPAGCTQAPSTIAAPSPSDEPKPTNGREEAAVG